MKKEIWVRKARSFQEAEDMDLQDYISMTAGERLSVLQELREEYDKFGANHARRERLQKVARFAKQA